MDTKKPTDTPPNGTYRYSSPDAPSWASTDARRERIVWMAEFFNKKSEALPEGHEKYVVLATIGEELAKQVLALLAPMTFLPAPVAPLPALRVAVDSSVIASVGFQHTTSYRGTLEIEFVSGKIYQYFNVPQGIYDDLLEARSVGEYFNHHVRGQFEQDEITR